jgi:hypothetical protein
MARNKPVFDELLKEMQDVADGAKQEASTAEQVQDGQQAQEAAPPQQQAAAQEAGAQQAGKEQQAAAR